MSWVGVRRTFGLLLVAVLAAAPAAAQQTQGTGQQGTPPPGGTSSSASTPGKLTVIGTAGTTVGNTVASPTFAGGVGWTLSQHLEIVGQVGRTDNVLLKTLRDDVRTDAGLLSPVVGAPVMASSSESETYGRAAIRLYFKTSPHVGVYAEFGGCFSHVNGKLSASANGVDESGTLESEVAIPGSETKGMGTVDVGFSFRLNAQTYVDSGWRYERIASVTPLYTNGLYGAFRRTF
jgi:hypothetical protein